MKPQEVAGFQTQEEVLILYTWYTRIADENENRAYRTNRYNNTQNRFEYRRQPSIGTSGALARNETRYIAFLRDIGNQQVFEWERGGTKEERVNEIWGVHAWEFLFNFSKVRENAFVTMKLYFFPHLQ